MNRFRARHLEPLTKPEPDRSANVFRRTKLANTAGLKPMVERSGITEDRL